MSSLITWECSFLLVSMMWGIVLGGVYDIVRIFRRLVIHRSVIWICVEDILFWIGTGLIVFYVAYVMNDGGIRGFSIAGFVMGAVIYHFGTRGWLVENVSGIIKFLFKPLKIISIYLRMKASEVKKG